MQLTDLQNRWLNGESGHTVQWAMEFVLALGRFYDVPSLIPIESAHFAPDVRMGGDTSVALLERFVKDGARIRVHGYLDPCHIDFEKEAEIVAACGLTQSFVEGERHIIRLCRQLGFYPTQSCIPYQSFAPPRYGGAKDW